MAFTQDTFAPVGPQSTESPSIYSYATADSDAVITTTGYFDKKKGQLSAGDFIITDSSSGSAIYQVQSDTSTVQKAVSGTGTPSDLVFVTSENDFPAPAGDLSTLEEKTYLISRAGIIDVSFGVKFANLRTIITGFGRLSATLRFTNTSANANIVNDTGLPVTITDTFIESPNAPMFDCVGDGATSIFTVEGCILGNCADLGKIDSFVRTQINGGTLIAADVTGGLDILGTSDTVLLNDIQSAANNVTPTFNMDDPGLAITNLSVTNIAISTLTGSNQFAEVDPTKVTAGLVADSSFNIDDALGTSINNATVNFIVDRVQGIEETRKIGSVSRAPGTIAIAMVSTPVEIGGSWLGANLSQFSALNPGIQYDGLPAGDIFQISATVSGSKAGSTGSDVYTCAIYNNDVLIADSLAISEISDKGGSFFMNTFTTLTTNDHLTLFISNEDSTNDFDLTEAKISINRVS